MKTIYLLGECMVELRATDDTTMKQSFAGDIYNCAVYLKRTFNQINTGIVTAVGQDKLSDRMLQQFQQEQLDSSLVFKAKDKHPGIYLIETDSAGERSFSYWRKDSAARKVCDFLNDAELAQIAQSDMLFFSGIALGVIEEPSRELFWRKLEKLKAQGVTLVFDPNYRASMWQNPEEAAQSFHRAFQLADIAMPGVEDLEVLFQVNSAQQVMAFCQQYELKEIVVKNGPQSVLTFDGESLLNHVITPVKNVVDTTSAGDAFDGVYLGSRLSGKSISEAVSFAAKAAGIVIQFPGAIAPAEAFQQAMSQAS
ncbi:sugar kinase [Planctobacterium marinum]|uniref:sugar kinase n=1 Tax=Planctobacterium marinum TaxID=1631968 RepID=UPI001E55CD81|nr:sugar kinase [Planctobacterium marinum]MCC2605169.1 sugar kinase [Planctobacterium marinum]